MAFSVSLSPPLDNLGADDGSEVAVCVRAEQLASTECQESHMCLHSVIPEQRGVHVREEAFLDCGDWPRFLGCSQLM
jgi:hypothetical protein